MNEREKKNMGWVEIDYLSFILQYNVPSWFEDFGRKRSGRWQLAILCALLHGAARAIYARKPLSGLSLTDGSFGVTSRLTNPAFEILV